jgi:hypothetical protein
MCSETFPHIDGSSNFDRVEFICEAMGWDRIDLSVHHDLSDITTCKEWEIVEAHRQLLILQIDFLRRCASSGLIEEEELRSKVTELSLEVQRVKWHKFHLEQGKPTPPFSFFGLE